MFHCCDTIDEIRFIVTRNSFKSVILYVNEIYHHVTINMLLAFLFSKEQHKCH